MDDLNLILIEILEELKKLNERENVIEERFSNIDDTLNSINGYCGQIYADMP